MFMSIFWEVYNLYRLSLPFIQQILIFKFIAKSIKQNQKFLNLPSKLFKNVGYHTFTKLYRSGVCPILEYSAGVWGYVTGKELDYIQNRAFRYFLGVNRFCPIAAISWVSVRTSSFVTKTVWYELITLGRHIANFLLWLLNKDKQLNYSMH